jgi:hypothetical protein
MKSYGILGAILTASFVQNALAALPTGATLFDVNVPSLCAGATLAITAINFQSAQVHSDYVLTYQPRPGVDDALLLPQRPIIEEDVFPFPRTILDEIFISRREEGRFHSVPLGSDWGYKLEAGYIFPCSGNNLVFSYLHYHHGRRVFTRQRHHGILVPTLSNQWPTVGSVTIVNPNLSLPFITLYQPGGLLPFPIEPNFATAEVNVHHNVFDFDLGQSVNLGCRTRIKYFGGLRYANLNNQFNVIYNYRAIEPDALSLPGLAPSKVKVGLSADYTETIFQMSKYGGVGPHFGVDAVYHMAWGFGIISSLSASILVGETNTALERTFTKLNIATLTESDNPASIFATPFVFLNTTTKASYFKYPGELRVVPNLDAKLGFDYSYQWCKKSHTKVNLEVGYRVSEYFNIIDRISTENRIENPIGERNSINQHFEGFYLGIQVNT